LIHMITHYVDDTSHWKKWQQKYKYGVFLIYPPDPVLSEVNALREKYDKESSATCDAHISLTVPLPRPLNHVDWNKLEQIVSSFRSFVIHYGPLKDYLPHPGVCLSIEPQKELDRVSVKTD